MPVDWSGLDTTSDNLKMLCERLDVPTMAVPEPKTPKEALEFWFSGNFIKPNKNASSKLFENWS